LAMLEAADLMESEVEACQEMRWVRRGEGNAPVLVTSRSMPWTGKKESAARAKIALIWTMVIGNEKNRKNE